MKTDRYKVRIDELIMLGLEVMKTQKAASEWRSASVNELSFNELRSGVLSFFRTVFGELHPLYKEFDKNVKRSSPSDTNVAIGILKAAKQEIDGGWLVSLKGLVSAEIFSDFLEMSEHLLEEGYKDPAAVMIGSVLEEHLRNLCTTHSVDTFILKGTDQVHKKADIMNADLKKAGVFGPLEQKSVTAWLGLRNSAAHGKYEEYRIDQVKIMYQGVLDFIMRVK